MVEKIGNISRLSSDVFNQLLITATFIFLIWLIYYWWKNRRVYELAAKFAGPTWIPIIGCAEIVLAGHQSREYNPGYRDASSFLVDNFLYIDTAQTCADIVEKHKSPVRLWLGPKLVILTTDPEQLQIVLTSSKTLSKGFFYSQFEFWMGKGLITAPEDIWRRHKKVISPIFNQKVLDSFVDVFVEKNNILVKELKKEVDKGYFDMFKYASPCTLDSVCQTMMGVNLKIQGGNVKFADEFEIATDIGGKLVNNPLLQLKAISLAVGLEQNKQRCIHYVHEFSNDIIQNKKRLLKENHKPAPKVDDEDGVRIPFYKTRKGFLDLLLDVHDSNFTDEEIREEVMTMVSAGNDTTANVASFTLIIMGMYKDIQKKAYEELIDVLGDDPTRPITAEDLPKLEYLERVIKETMRLTNPVPLVAREVKEELEIGGKLMPAGANVVMPLLYLHKDPKLWPEPHKFDPDRFLPEEVAKRHAYSYLPFGGGPRICVGMKYAMMAVKVLVASVLRNYETDCDYRIEDIKMKFVVVYKPMNGHRIKLLSRKPHNNVK